jgi:hypothetical protein
MKHGAEAGPNGGAEKRMTFPDEVILRRVDEETYGIERGRHLTANELRQAKKARLLFIDLEQPEDYAAEIQVSLHGTAIRAGGIGPKCVIETREGKETPLLLVAFVNNAGIFLPDGRTERGYFLPLDEETQTERVADLKP